MERGNREERSRMLWLLYFNRTLYDQGIITEAERNRMKREIMARGLSDSEPRKR